MFQRIDSVKKTHEIEIKHITTLGGNSVLVNPLKPLDQPLEPTEFLEKAESKDLEGYYWRKRTIPDFATLAVIGLHRPQIKPHIEASLKTLPIQHKQIIFFTKDHAAITKQILNNSYGTITSLKDLAQKEYIFLLGSESQRKIIPLQAALAKMPIDSKKIALIGLPAESGTALQPVGHEQTYNGGYNRLRQLRCFREELRDFLNRIVNKNRHIYCLAIENGIGLYPVESITQNGILKIATSPLTSDSDKKYHCYDQAHILFDTGAETTYRVTKPTCIHFEFLSDKKEDLINLFEDGLPTYEFFLKQSKYRKEMLKRQDAGRIDAFPLLYEGTKVITSTDLIEKELVKILTDHFNMASKNDKYITYAKLGAGAATIALGALCLYRFFKEPNSVSVLASKSEELLQRGITQS